MTAHARRPRHALGSDRFVTDAHVEKRIVATVGGTLDVRSEPTVDAARAHHLAELRFELADGATLTATEYALLGRAGEEPGR
jgi:urease accessory protein